MNTLLYSFMEEGILFGKNFIAEDMEFHYLLRHDLRRLSVELEVANPEQLAVGVSDLSGDIILDSLWQCLIHRPEIDYGLTSKNEQRLKIHFKLHVNRQ